MIPICDSSYDFQGANTGLGLIFDVVCKKRDDLCCADSCGKREPETDYRSPKAGLGSNPSNMMLSQKARTLIHSSSEQTVHAMTGVP